MNQDVINWKNGDFAVENKLKVIYDYHLSNKTECVFTSKSIKFAYDNKDIELLKQLLDNDIKYEHDTHVNSTISDKIESNNETRIDNIKHKSIHIRHTDEYTVKPTDNIIYAYDDANIILPNGSEYDDKFIIIVYSIYAYRKYDGRNNPTLMIDNFSYKHDIHSDNCYTMTYTLHYSDGWNVISVVYMDDIVI